MVFTAIADITLEITIYGIKWGAKQAFNVGYWAMWGTPKTETELLLEKQNKNLELLHEDLMRINDKLLINNNENNIKMIEAVDEVKMIENHLTLPDMVTTLTEKPVIVELND